MKTLGLALLTLMSLAALAQAAETAPCWIKASAAIEDRLWVLCDDAHLYTSRDNGRDWLPSVLSGAADLRAVAFLDERRGFLAGNKGTLLATFDGGSEWRQVETATAEHLTSIHFTGERGWVAGYHGVILHTKDGGRTWTPQESGVTQTLESIYFSDAKHGWAVGWQGTIIRTVDGGHNWQQIHRPDSSMWTLNSVCFQDKDNGWIVGFGGGISRSRDGGVTWEDQKSPVRSPLTSIRFDRFRRGWIAAGNQILLSEDDGATWRTVPVEEKIFVSEIQPSGDSVWAVGTFGLLQQSGIALAFSSVRAPGLATAWIKAAEADLSRRGSTGQP
jgi:photosystem II stability/assembly factor-like uncharacterized protein